ncbi:hypothetical protein CK203_040885 [Vitis vinifera]|uniref:Uncharacterized protein n=1 Tax=Vitis vinifera TaxID=29760 RepID=A0A438H4G0_VITVI|nr:hypothetical protein CK203_040885 [Vitis vinifera]
MEITRWEMKILKRLLKRIQRLERMNVDVNSLPPSRSFWWLEGNDLAVQMDRRGMGFWRLGNLWKKMKPHKATGEFMHIGGRNLIVRARLMNLNSKEHDWNPMPDLESLSRLFHRDTMRIRSKDDAKIARNFKVRCGWTGDIDVERPMTEKMAEILAVFEL